MNPAEFANIASAEESFWWYRGMRKIMFRLLDPLVRTQGFQRALEAGCGTGYFAKVLANRYNFRVCAVDLGREGLRHGRQLGVDRLIQADIATLPFADKCFDLVLSMDVIVHFRNGEEEGAVKELARVLQPGGILALRVAALDLLRSRHSEFAGERQRFTRKRLLHLVERHGIRTLRCTYANSLLLPIAFAKFRLLEPLLGSAPQSGVQPIAPWLNAMLWSPLALESWLIGAGLDFPLGQSLILLGRRE